MWAVCGSYWVGCLGILSIYSTYSKTDTESCISYQKDKLEWVSGIYQTTKRTHFPPATTPKQENLSLADAPKPTRNGYLHGKTEKFHLQNGMFLPFCEVKKF